jgi:hypothetical protein
VIDQPPFLSGAELRAAEQQYCADTQPGKARLEACMKAHVDDFSEPCKEALARSRDAAPRPAEPSIM